MSGRVGLPIDPDSESRVGSGRVGDLVGRWSEILCEKMKKKLIYAGSKTFIVAVSAPLMVKFSSVFDQGL